MIFRSSAVTSLSRLRNCCVNDDTVGAVLLLSIVASEGVGDVLERSLSEAVLSYGHVRYEHLSLNLSVH